MTRVILQAWSDDDLPLLQKLLGDPAVMTYLGGPETPEHILQRHQRYLHISEGGDDQMFKIVLSPGLEAVGRTGYWMRNWQDQPVYETGWMILPAYHGGGIATEAVRALINLVRLTARSKHLHAFPSVLNEASNAICRKLGFSVIEECQFEYPPDHFMKVNDWRLDLNSL